MSFCAKKLLYQFNVKATKTRCMILQVLNKNNGHLSADAIHADVLKSLPNVGISSIYRNLSQLEQQKVILKHLFNNSCTYELNIGKHHDHLICLKCNNIEEFIDDEIEQRQLIIANKYNFKITHHTLNLYGVCQKCNA